MAVRRMVPLPLGREPEVLWGLTARDVGWLLGGAAADLAIWRLAGSIGKPAAGGLCAMAAAAAVALAWIRVEGRRLPQWAWLGLRFWLAPRLYLPGSGEDTPTGGCTAAPLPGEEGKTWRRGG